MGETRNTLPGRGMNTLRNRLLLFLLAPLLLLLVVGMVIDYRSAVGITNDAYDEALLNTAIAISARLNDKEDVDAADVDLPDLAQNMLHAGKHRHVYYAVLVSRGNLVSGINPLQRPTVPEEPSTSTFGFQQLEDKSLRYVVHRSDSERLGPLNIIVAETTEEREDAARRMVFNTLWPNLLQIAVALTLLYVGIRRGLMPLEHLARNIAERKEQDFSPIPQQDIPDEARPLVHAMNQLMGNLQAAEAAQRAFISSAAHQLRLPLTALQTQLELAAAAFPPQEQQRLLEIRNSTGRLTHLVRQLLALARTTKEAVDSEQKETVCLDKLVETTGREFVDRALTQDIDLGFEIQSANTIGWQWLLGEMLSNLIDNALRHADSQVTVHCGVNGDGRSFLAVEDDGPGIPEDLRERVFERFFRMSADHTTGTGLGLSIVKEVALRHGADISVLPPPTGKGLIFRIIFPAQN